MRKMKSAWWIILLIMPLMNARAGYFPAKVQVALKSMYPQVTEVAWSQQGVYYVANVMVNSFDTDVWFDASARWVMTLTHWETTDELPPSIYNAFTMSHYAGEQVKNVTQATFPKCPAIVVIKVGQQNIDIQYQLFYAQDGTLIRTYNMGYTEGTLSPDTFNCP